MINFPDPANVSKMKQEYVVVFGVVCCRIRGRWALLAATSYLQRLPSTRDRQQPFAVPRGVLILLNFEVMGRSSRSGAERRPGQGVAGSASPPGRGL